MSKVGFVELGIMGAPMAGHLLAAGHELFVHDLRPPAQALIDQGATIRALEMLANHEVAAKA